MAVNINISGLRCDAM